MALTPRVPGSPFHVLEAAVRDVCLDLPAAGEHLHKSCTEFTCMRDAQWACAGVSAACDRKAPGQMQKALYTQYGTGCLKISCGAHARCSSCRERCCRVQGKHASPVHQ